MKRMYDEIVLGAKAYYVIMGLIKLVEDAVLERDYETLNFIANELYNITHEIIAKRRRKYDMEQNNNSEG